jgi:hypothetical protein
MASLVTSLLGGGGGQVLDGVAHVIDSIKGKNPEDAAKLAELAEKYKSDLLVAQLEGEKAELQAQAQTNDTAGQNIRAEITSPDPYVRRARATPLWVGALVLVWNYCLMPLVALWTPAKPVELPQFFWYAWMFAIGGYVASRVADRALGGAGGGLSFMGVKLDSKGD